MYSNGTVRWCDAWEELIFQTSPGHSTLVWMWSSFKGRCTPNCVQQTLGSSLVAMMPPFSPLVKEVCGQKLSYCKVQWLLHVEGGGRCVTLMWRQGGHGRRSAHLIWCSPLFLMQRGKRETLVSKSNQSDAWRWLNAVCLCDATELQPWFSILCSTPEAKAMGRDASWQLYIENEPRG